MCAVVGRGGVWRRRVALGEVGAQTELDLGWLGSSSTPQEALSFGQQVLINDALPRHGTIIVGVAQNSSSIRIAKRHVRDPGCAEIIARGGHRTPPPTRNDEHRDYTSSASSPSAFSLPSSYITN